MRSPTFERQWFEEMARNAHRWGHGVERFVDEVSERLEKGAREYGDNEWLNRSLVELIREAREEGADVPGWLVLAAQKLNDELAAGAISPDQAIEIQSRFLRAAALGLLIHEELSEADKLYRTALAESQWSRSVCHNG